MTPPSSLESPLRSLCSLPVHEMNDTELAAYVASQRAKRESMRWAKATNKQKAVDLEVKRAAKELEDDADIQAAKDQLTLDISTIPLPANPITRSLLAQDKPEDEFPFV